jgi:hypothetical protein
MQRQNLTIIGHWHLRPVISMISLVVEGTAVPLPIETTTPFDHLYEFTILTGRTILIRYFL